MKNITVLLLTLTVTYFVGVCSGETSITCERSTAFIVCPNPHQTLKILSANYGRTQPGSVVCPYRRIRTTNCHSSVATHVVVQRCQGRNFCQVPASNDIFGDPCVGTFKYLQVEYYCD